MRKTIAALALLLLAGCASEAPAAQTVTDTATTTATTTRTATSTLTPEPAGTVTESATVTETAMQTVVQTITLPAPGPATAFTDGTYVVGTQVQPGTYQADDPDGERCYWKRMDSAGETIDNDYEGSTILVVHSTDFAINTTGCGNWSKVG